MGYAVVDLLVRRIAELADGPVLGRATRAAMEARIDEPPPDWGRDFSYGRTATVVATEPTHLVAFPAAALRELMLDNPAVDRAIRRIAPARLGSR